MQRALVLAVLAGSIAGFPSSPVQAQGVLDHLMCFKTKDPLAINATVDLITEAQPDFVQRGCRITKAIEFCVPVSKVNLQTPPPGAAGFTGQPLRYDYVCYSAKCPKQPLPPAHTVADQFGARPEQRYQPTKVCIPASKFPTLCGASGSPICGGACTNGGVCRIDSMTKQCTCQPAPCGGPPDKAGVCGGACPTPGEVCHVTSTASGQSVCGCGAPPAPCGVNPLTGSCGGDCTDAAAKCLQDTAGNCTCQPAPSPPDFTCTLGTGGTCGGTCPNPTEACVPSTAVPGQPCECRPAACKQDPATGACVGTCAGVAGTCHLDTTGQGCTCGPPPQCGFDPASHTCGGPCPPGLECQINSANECTCQQTCGQLPGGTCGGGCPAGQLCTQTAAAGCQCTPLPACSLSTTTPALCGGACPPGLTCRFREVSPTTLVCACF